ncbi:MAG TPA: carboxypeptidase-like regulatory domain-containing protein [Terriglobia bacterium]|nr:carboxypeptidase-like regulatory domain-containing protein [Terriglobia bacterium]
MKKAQILSTSLILGLPMAFFPPTCTANSFTCREIKLKSLRHMAGVIVDPTGALIPDARVEILKGEMQVAAVKTDQNGRFSFEQLDAGDYQMRAAADGFLTSSFNIVLAKPKPSSKRMLRIVLNLGNGCTNAQIFKSK